MKHLNLCADLYGCPNRCRHCWLGHVKHTRMDEDADRDIVTYFKPYFDSIAFYSWFREPDFCDDYEARWERDIALSVHAAPQRFELASFYRLNRDPQYVTFLKRVGVKTVQLTFFGMEEMTDRYVGRPGAFRELVAATDCLIANGIAPRYQAFINMENKNDLVRLLAYIKEARLEERCAAIGTPFSFFVHEGTCDGENRKLYDIRIEKSAIPPALLPYYLDYDQLLTERECCALLRYDPAPHVPHNEDEITLYVTSDYGVYYNFTNISEHWRIGNIKKEPAEELVRKIVEEDTFALNAARGISLGKLVARYGDPTSEKAFSLGDYKDYLLNHYIESHNR